MKWSRTVNNRTLQIAYKYTGIKICYKIDKFAFEGNKRKVVYKTVLDLKKWSPLQKKFEKLIGPVR